MLTVKCFVKSLSNRYSDVNISALVMRVSNSNMLLWCLGKRKECIIILATLLLIKELTDFSPGFFNIYSK